MLNLATRTLGVALLVAGAVTLVAALVIPRIEDARLETRAAETVTQYRQESAGEPTRVLPLPRYTQPPTTLPEPAEPAPQQAQETQVAPTPGEAFGVITIPALGMETVILEGVEDAELDQGSGHYPSTGLPSQGRTVGVAVHRGLVADIDTQIQPGDEIRVETTEGTHTYRWEGYEVVDPEDVHVLADQGREVLVITTCHPRHSTAQRLVGTAVFVSEAERL